MFPLDQIVHSHSLFDIRASDLKGLFSMVNETRKSSEFPLSPTVIQDFLSPVVPSTFSIGSFVVSSLPNSLYVSFKLDRTNFLL